MQQIKILGTGINIPKNKVESSFFDKENSLKPGYTEKITSLKHRFFLGDDCVDELIVGAVLKSLKKACLKLDDIECIISASATMGQMIPCNGASFIGH